MKLYLSLIALALSVAACSHTASSNNAAEEKTAAATPCSISTTPRELEANPLLLGAHMDDVEGIRCLLQQGLNPNAAGIEGNTLLMVAAGLDKSGEVTHLFLEKAATNANAVNNSGNTALMYAARFGRTEAARQLLARSVDTSAVNNDGETALALAQKNGHTAIVQMLRAAGAKE